MPYGMTPQQKAEYAGAQAQYSRQFAGQAPTVGQPIPNWAGTQTNKTFAPTLSQPSEQLWARMTPDARQQYLGYQQWQTGASPEVQLWRMRATAPPSGNAPRMTYQKPRR